MSIGGNMSERARQAVERDAVPQEPGPQRMGGHPNDGRVNVSPDGLLSSALGEIGMVKGGSGKISGYCRVLVNGKAIGALVIYAPKAEDSQAGTLRAPKSIERDNKSGVDLLAEMDRLYPLAGLSGDDLIAQMVKRAPLQVRADEYFGRAKTTQAEYDARVAAAKGSWEGKTALDVLHWHLTSGATRGPHDDADLAPDAEDAVE